MRASRHQAVSASPETISVTYHCARSTLRRVNKKLRPLRKFDRLDCAWRDPASGFKPLAIHFTPLPVGRLQPERAMYKRTPPFALRLAAPINPQKGTAMETLEEHQHV